MGEREEEKGVRKSGKEEDICMLDINLLSKVNNIIQKSKTNNNFL